MVVTLSLWSWSTMSKLRTVGQALPVPVAPAVGTIFAEVPAEGTNSRPSRSSWNAARKNLMQLQNDTRPRALSGCAGTMMSQLGLTADEVLPGATAAAAADW